jgi:hypothetical protein
MCFIFRRDDDDLESYGESSSLTVCSLLTTSAGAG